VKRWRLGKFCWPVLTFTTHRRRRHLSDHVELADPDGIESAIYADQASSHRLKNRSSAADR
jgi:hypothetical protein